MKKLIFFIIALVILIFSVIVVNISPCIYISYISSITNRSKVECSIYSDAYNYEEKKESSQFKNGQEEKDLELKIIKNEKIRCERKKAMKALEYTAFNFNILLGFICVLFSFLYYLNFGDVGKIIGLIGSGSGIIGFVLTFTYVIESILVFTDVEDILYGYRIDSDGGYLEWNESLQRYTCIFYEEDNPDSLRLRFADYGNKFLNYNKDVYFAEEEEKNFKYLRYDGCKSNFNINYEKCKLLNDKSLSSSDSLYGELKYYYSLDHKQKWECKKILFLEVTKYRTLKLLYYRWLATIIIGCLILIFKIGLGIFGFLLFKESISSSYQVKIK